MITVLLVVAAAALIAVLRRRSKSGGVGRRSAMAVVVAIIGLHTLVGSPAIAQELDCVPNPERPGAGMVGAIDPPKGNGEAGTPYQVYGFAGMVWHVYDESCGGIVPSGVSDPGATIDNWAGNELFNLAKIVVGATNSLHYTLLDGGILGGLNDQIGEAAESIFDNVYAQLFSVFALVLAIFMFRQIWKGDLATVSKRAVFALGGMWLAASSMVIVANYDRIDDVIVRTTTGIQAGFVDPGDSRVDYDILPTQLHDKVVYENWLRGEFGSPEAPQAEEFGPRLLAAQAWTRDDVVSGRDADDAAEAAKKAEYKKIAGELGPATGYFKGTDGSRTGSGVLAFFQSIVYSLFQFFAKLAVLLAQLLLRILALAAPVIGLVALVHHDILRRVGRAVGAVILNVLVLAMLAGIHFKFLELIFSPDAGLSLLTQMLLAGIVTFVFFLVGRPMKRMWQMVEMSVGAAGASVSGPGTGIFSRFRRNKHAGPTPQDNFWENLRDEDEATGEGGVLVRGGRRHRPEASNPVTVHAERMDAARASIGGPRAAIGGAQTLIGPAADGSQSAVVGTSGARLVPRSRTADTVPVADRGWDRGEDAVVVPSRVPGGPDPVDVPSPPSRPADVEVVAGRPVHVVYRPSRGLEVAADQVRPPLPRQDGPRDTDRLVR
ncbi:magnesium transporter [Actinokineospora guangxiensis]|uniref:Magnesium transporter n=1 Tax=Actinokineospora guangxiensis TaxID=1490288 RepID=A0ABW0EKN1_9PSEU